MRRRVNEAGAVRLLETRVKNLDVILIEKGSYC